MTVPFRTHGLDLWPCGTRGSWCAFDGTIIVGTAFPVVVAEPDGPWFGRRAGRTAVKCKSKHLAFAHIVDDCPDCVCDPALCAADDTSEHCAAANCGYCLHGCSEVECPAPPQPVRRRPGAAPP